MLSAILNILTHLKQYSEFLTGAVVIGLIALLKYKDRQIGDLKVDNIVQSTEDVLKGFNQQEQNQAKTSDELAKELRDALKNTNPPINNK